MKSLGMETEYELYYRFTCKKFCHDVQAIPIEYKWTKRFINEDDAYAELNQMAEIKRNELMKEYEECIGPVKFIRNYMSNSSVDIAN